MMFFHVKFLSWAKTNLFSVGSGSVAPLSLAYRATRDDKIKAED